MGIVVQRLEIIDSGRFPSTGALANVRVASATCTSRPRHPAQRPLPDQDAVPSSSGTSDRPWVRWSGATAKVSQSVACRSTVVVRASLVPGATPGHDTSRGMRPSSGVHGHLRLAPDAPLAEVVAVVGAQDDGGGVPGLVPVDDVEDPSQPVVDHRELGAVLAAQVHALPVRQPRLLLALR